MDSSRTWGWEEEGFFFLAIDITSLNPLLQVLSCEVKTTKRLKLVRDDENDFIDKPLNQNLVDTT